MSNMIKSFNRYELKYILTRDQAQALAADLTAYLEADSHSLGDGRYLISSLYYDTSDYKAYWDKIEGHAFRRKVRIRTYGGQHISPKSTCFVEIKQRLNKTVQKKRIFIPYQAAEALCAFGRTADEGESLSIRDRQVMAEVQYLTRSLHLQPSLIVSYQRLALNGGQHDPGLRVTFDTSLKYRAHSLSLLASAEAENAWFLRPEMAIMEVKVNDRVPYWLTKVLSNHGCTLQRISKYCTALEQAAVLQQRDRLILSF